MKKLVYLALSIFCSLVAYIVVSYPELQKTARESEVKLALQAFKTAEDSYFSEWKKYSSSRIDIGFNTVGSKLRHKIYLKVDELSDDEIKLLGNNLPDIKDKSYKVIAKNEGEIYATYWSFDNNGNLEKIVDVPKR